MEVKSLEAPVLADDITYVAWTLPIVTGRLIGNVTGVGKFEFLETSRPVCCMSDVVLKIDIEFETNGFDPDGE